MFEFAVLTDKGLKRRINQDAVKVNPECRLFVLSDGMGGHAAGEVASQLTVDTVEEFVALSLGTSEVTWPFGYDIQQPFAYNILGTAVRLANVKVRHEAEKKEIYAGMGATLVCLLLDDEGAFYTHVGDSRLYLLRQGRLKQLTQDHSIVQEQLRLGIISPEDVENHTYRHVVTRAIGSQELDFDVRKMETRPGDLFLICCDGLTDMIDDQGIEQVLRCEESLESRCRRLVEQANQAGGDDNISVILVHCESAISS
ncbi:MAG TPA: Stp1/IreP family PP2C-type Ser/Thr phosphatase [Acidobacteriota bacterium]|nr:Stp1/IreP family PP2C-type Ser/Thr phosphatase [Acidobacteriota bacterium]